MAKRSSSIKTIFVLILIYSLVIFSLYVLPIGLDGEWYSFYSYLDSHGATPYIDAREGYPPLGFLIYMPLYYISNNNSTFFSLIFRLFNGALLVATLYTLYLILRTMSNERRALKFTLFYAVLPSVIITNTYSNDIVALLFSALSIYMMLKKRVALCALLIGLATLSKGFPIALLIPSLIVFKEWRERLKLVSITTFTLIIASLPFVLINPFTYLSTFTHHASRGPWETVWALIDGYYSHGGLLHLYFDKFFYHFNLLKIYPANHFDNAIYEWNFESLPDLLTLSQIIFIILLSLKFIRGKNGLINLVGLLYISDIFFFKGYSTQFSVSTQFYIILASLNNPLIFLIPSEISHMMQILSWLGLPFISQEFLRNIHFPLLIFSIILRSIVFIFILSNAFIGSNINLNNIISKIKFITTRLRIFTDRKLIILISATVVTSTMSSATLLGYMNNNALMFRTLHGQLRATTSEWQSIEINGLDEHDQVMVRLDTHTWLEAEVISNDQQVRVERGVRNPYNLKGSFNETMLFFKANSEHSTLKLKMKHPNIPFRVTDGFDGDLRAVMDSNGTALSIRLADNGTDGHDSLFRIAYPCKIHTGHDFSLELKYKITEGNLSRVQLDVFDDTDEWLYSFNASTDFVLKADSGDVFGYSNLMDDDVSLIAIVMILKNGSSATINLEELNINDNTKLNKIEFYAEQQEKINYDIFIEHDFQPSLYYISTVLLSLTLATVTIVYLYRKM